MVPSSTSLDRMHDIVVPTPIPWWPPAPGWYVVIAILVGGLVVSGCLLFQRWRAHAYRRQAVQELAASTTVAEVSEVLRRTALVIASRTEVANQVGAKWPDWLAEHAEVTMSERVRGQLTRGAYARREDAEDVRELKDYSVRWIKSHPAKSAVEKAGQASQTAAH